MTALRRDPVILPVPALVIAFGFVYVRRNYRLAEDEFESDEEAKRRLGKKP